ncbi:MAG: hypothetical protein IPP47_20185 [Bryobacterales bacterium]|nr:hypothetical protein [Bryobacterales bacterium]
MKKLLAILTLWIVAASAQGLTPAQKEADFRYMASLYSTYYAPVTWKAQLFQFNALDLKPWLTRVANTTTDLDFYELCAEYVNSLNDTHDSFVLPSDFNATLGFSVDLYDGVLLFDSISRSRLPVAGYPFVIGDELVSVDGEDALALAARLAKYVAQGNPRAALRQGAARIASRAQSRFPHAVDLPDSSEIVVRRQSGALETYSIPWVKTGTPLEVGPVPSPRSARAASATRDAARRDPLAELQTSAVSPDLQQGLLGYGARAPIFAPPSFFTRRLGGASADFFYSGVFEWYGRKIGYIRIPSYSPTSTAVALRQFDTEITYMNDNTDGLVIDEMRNTGGSLCFGENIATRLVPYAFQVTGFEARPFWSRVVSFYNAMVSAKAANAPPETIEQYEVVYKEFLAANREGRELTNPIPFCTGSLTRQPNAVVYRKPVMVLIDDFSTSTADSVAAMMQDSDNAFIYGMRSNGAGGNNISIDSGVYSEAYVGMTLALQSRPSYVTVDGFPTTRYIENVGVRPHVEMDYMTKENLLGGGLSFVNNFLQAMNAYIDQRQ